MGVLTQPHELRWGTMVLDSDVPTDLPWRCESMADGASLGSPVPAREALSSLLVDGDLSVVTSYGNREITFIVRISALDGDGLAQGEAALMALVLPERPPALVWTPPSIGAWPAVFDVVTAQLDPSDDVEWDFEEEVRAFRYYKITFECLPWARSEDTVVIPALDVPVDPESPPVVVSVNDCTSITNWDRKTSPTSGAWSSLTGPTVVSGGVRATGTLAAGSGYGWLSLELTQTVDMTGTPYLMVEVQKSASNESAGQGEPSTAVVSARFTGDQLDEIADPVAIVATSDPAVDRYYFLAPDDFDAVLFRLRVERRTSLSRAVVLRIVDVSRTDRLGVAGTAGFQVARTAVIGGSAPTQAAIRFDAGDDPLVGSTALIYTGASPAVPMRGLVLEASGAVPGESMISGQVNDLATPMVFLVPTSQLSHANYSLLARLGFTGSETIEWSARLVSSTGDTIPGSEVVESGAMLCVNPTSDPWRVHAIAEIPMPVVAIEGDVTHAVEVTLSMASGGVDVDVDEAWLFDTENGAVTVVHEPSANQLATIELRSPQLDAPHPAVMGTWLTYGTQDISRLVTLFGTHLLRPGLLHVFTATDLARFAALSLEFYERFHTFPGPALIPEEDAS